MAKLSSAHFKGRTRVFLDCVASLFSDAALEARLLELMQIKLWQFIAPYALQVRFAETQRKALVGGKLLRGQSCQRMNQDGHKRTDNAVKVFHV